MTKPEKNPVEEMRGLERDAQELAAKVAEDMLRHPRRRWAYAPIYQLMKWLSRKCDEWLKDEGWR